MKKSVFLLSMLFACTCAFAQNEITKVGEISGSGYRNGCPQDFFYDGKTHIIISDNEDYPTQFDIYDDNIQKIKSISLDVVPARISYEDLNLAYYCGYHFFLSQTLFNQDEEYEWIEMVGDDSNTTGFKIMQEGGTELCSVELANCSSSFRIFKFNDKLYLRAADSKADYYYLINSAEESGIKLVGKINTTKVSPTILDRSTPVTVDFTDGSDVSHNITVTSANGQVVDRQNVAAGQSSITLDTSHWGNGLNIVTTKNANNETQSCKIIVK